MTSTQFANNKTALTELAQQHPLLSQLSHYCQQTLNTPIWLVGGAVRDLLLTPQKDSKSFPTDLDVALNSKHVDTLCHWVSQTYNIKVIELDKAQQIYRLVAPEKEWTLDVSACQGESIETDLSRRDLTINAMAIELTTGTWLDLFEGEKDLTQKHIRHIKETNFDEDPLRLLRVFRFQSQLGLESVIDPDTLKIIHEKKTLITQPAKERIYQEFFKLLNAQGAPQALNDLIECGLFGPCFAPLNPPSTERLNDAYTQIRTDWANETEFMDAHYNTELTRYGLLGLLITLSDLAQHSEQILPFLKAQKWSKSLSQFLIKALGVLKNPPKLEDDAYCEQLFLGLNVNTWPLLAYWQIQQTITAKQAQVAWLYCQATIELEASLPILLDGHAISQLTQIPEGPEIGEILVNLRKQQRSGAINTLEDAKAWLVQFHL